MNVPDDRRYSAEHEWALVVDGRIRVGITDYAQDALGDVVYVELPEVGREVTKGESLAEVESTKSVADVYAPITGTVVAVNDELGERPELVNEDPFGAAWFAEIEGDLGPLADMLDAAGYRAITED
jgi:glycine cleavage system H protein